MELGKHGKLKGQEHPRVLRKTDPVPERPTPNAKPHPKTLRRFGFTYRMKLFSWRDREQWYETAKRRDQAMASHNRRYANSSDWITQATPIDRPAESSPQQKGDEHGG